MEVHACTHSALQPACHAPGTYLGRLRSRDPAGPTGTRAWKFLSEASLAVAEMGMSPSRPSLLKRQGSSSGQARSNLQQALHMIRLPTMAS